MWGSFSSWGCLVFLVSVSCDGFFFISFFRVGDVLLDAGEFMKRLAEVKDFLDIEVK